MSTNTNNKYSDVTLTDKDIKVFEAKKAKYFKGSIAVAVVYGVVALGLIILAVLTETGKTMLTVNLKPFVATMVFGIIIVVIIMVLQLYSLKPIHVETNAYDAQTCPDYWKLEQTPSDDLELIDEEARMNGGVRCVRDQAKTRGVIAGVVTPIHTGSVTYEADATNKVKTAARDYLDAMNLSTEGVMDCNKLYPSALGVIDEQTFADKKNTLRCDIARQCNFAWSSVCP